MCELGLSFIFISNFGTVCQDILILKSHRLAHYENIIPRKYYIHSITHCVHAYCNNLQTWNNERYTVYLHMFFQSYWTCMCYYWSSVLVWNSSILLEYIFIFGNKMFHTFSAWFRSKQQQFIVSDDNCWCISNKICNMLLW